MAREERSNNANDQVTALITEKENEIDNLEERSLEVTDVEELKTIRTKKKTLRSEIEALKGISQSITNETVQRNQQNSSQFNPLNVLGSFDQNENRNSSNDVYSTEEYRTAFRKYVTTGEVTPELRISQQAAERRADAMTVVADAAAVIPTTILNEVVKELKTYGQLYNRVRKMAIKGGVKIPISTITPTATWIGESTPSEKKKVDLSTSVSFTYFGLEVRISVSLLSDTVTLEIFEKTIIEIMLEAIVKAIDIAIVKGNGTTGPLGITSDTRVATGQKITLTPDEFTSWESWKKKVFAKMKLSYKAGAVFIMAAGTFEGYIDGMTDDNNQPIGRVNYGITEGSQRRFGGKEVIEVEDDVVTNYDDASTGDIVAIFANLKHYGWNSNMQLWLYRYMDHDSNEYVDKAILIADGKLIDPKSVLLIKKGAAS